MTPADKHRDDDDHDHDHDGHDHAHTGFQPDLREPSAEWEMLEIALRELLIDTD